MYGVSNNELVYSLVDSKGDCGEYDGQTCK